MESYVLITIDNTGFPDVEKQAQSGRFESDYSKIERMLHSATEGHSKKVAYFVDENTGESRATYMFPKRYASGASQVVQKASSSITEMSSYGGSGNPDLYAETSSRDIPTLHFSQSFKNERAKRSILAALAKANVVDYKINKKTISGELPITDISMMNDTDAQKKYRSSLFSETRRINREQKKKDKEKEAERRKREADKKQREADKKKREKEKEAKDDKNMRWAIGKAILSFFITTIALLKRIASSFISLASERQASSLSAIQLGYTTSDLRNFNRVERIVGMQEGTIESGTRSLYEKFGTELLLSQNVESLDKLLLGVGAKDSANARKLTKDLVSMAQGKMFASDVFTDMMSMMTTNWIANGANKNVLNERINNLKGLGFGDAADIITAFAKEYELASPDKKQEMASMNFSDWLASYGVFVSSAGVNQAKGEQELLKIKEQNKAIVEAWQNEVLATTFTLLEKINGVLAKVLKLLNLDAERSAIGQEYLDEGRSMTNEEYKEYREFFSSSSKKEIGTRLWKEGKKAQAAYVRYIAETQGYADADSGLVFDKMTEEMLPGTGTGAGRNEMLEVFESLSPSEQAAFFELADEVLADDKLKNEIKDSYLYRNAKSPKIEKEANESRKDYRARKKRETERNRMALTLWAATRLEHTGIITRLKDAETLELMRELGEDYIEKDDTNDIRDRISMAIPDLLEASSSYNTDSILEGNYTLTIRVQDRNRTTDVANIPLSMLQSDISNTISLVNENNGLLFEQISGGFYG